MAIEDKADSGTDIKGQTKGAATRAKQEAKRAKDRAARTAKDRAGQQTESVKGRVGDAFFDFAEEMFPETAKKRQRRDLTTVFVVGIAVGILFRQLLVGISR